MLCENSARWLYKLERNFVWESRESFERDLFFRDKKGRIRLIVGSDGVITVTRGFSWNGCSPKLCVMDILVGPPEGVVNLDTGRPKTYYASLVHDAMYQFLDVGAPISRGEADRFFLRLMQRDRFRPAIVYWLFVRCFGWIVWYFTRRHRRLVGESVDFASLALQKNGKGSHASGDRSPTPSEAGAA